MNRTVSLALCLSLAASISACSTKPRTFSAAVIPLNTAQGGSTSESVTFETCNQMVRTGRKNGFVSAAAQGAAGGVGVLAGAAGVAASGTIGIGTTAGGAILSAAIPFVGLAAGFGVNRLIRSGRERKYKAAMTTCMNEFGYDVVEWTRAPKKQPGTATLRASSPAPSSASATGDAAPPIVAVQSN